MNDINDGEVIFSDNYGNRFILLDVNKSYNPLGLPVDNVIGHMVATQETYDALLYILKDLSPTLLINAREYAPDKKHVDKLLAKFHESDRS